MTDATMLPQAVVEQQAKLGVSAEESKFERAKRQQARFRDRGGAFVPSTSNPLLGILLARTVSGESPSKSRSKDGTAKRLSSVKPRQTSARRASAVTASDKSQVATGDAKSKPSTSQKRKRKATEQEGGTIREPRDDKRAKGKKKAGNTGLGTEPPSSTKSKSTSKGKGKQRDTSAAQSSSGGNTKPKARAKPKPVKAVVEVLVSDDDLPLSATRPKIKSNSRKNSEKKGDEEADDEALIARKSVLPPMGIRPSNTKTTGHLKEEKIGSKSRTGENAKDKETTVATPRIITGEGKGKADTKTKGRAKFEQDTAEPVEDEQPPQRASRPQKRKKDDNQDDRPWKSVKFSDPCPTHASSQNLKENQFDKPHKTVAKSRVKDDPGILSKVTAKLPSRAKRSKGPPREVLERIKASAGRHLQCTDSDPDELDCLS